MINRFGHIFSFQSWGESHGPAIGVVVDGVPARLDLSESDIQTFLDQRKPGQSRFTTQRQEPDQVEILSGVFNGQTTGTPISLMIRNQDQRSKDYGDIKDKFRPGHADYTYHEKYGIRDYRGGGRSSARETACRVAAGAVARKILGDKIKITGALVQVGPHRIGTDDWDIDQISQNPFFAPEADIVPVWEEHIDSLRKAGSSCGAIIEVRANNVPVGLGEPVYSKLDNMLASAMMSINAVKGVEIGDGFACVDKDGAASVDEMRQDPGLGPTFLSNHAGGSLGGISSGQDIIVRFVVKPTSSILTERRTIDKDGQETTIQTKGRHDPCVGIRAVPVGEAMMACVLADLMLMHRARS